MLDIMTKENRGVTQSLSLQIIKEMQTGVLGSYPSDNFTYHGFIELSRCKGEFNLL
jgi:hypothetical protein